MEEEENPWNNKWCLRLAGAGVIVGMVWGLYRDGDMLGALGGAVFGGLAFWLLGMPLSIGISAASRETNAFKQGFMFAFGIIMGLATLDLLLLGGDFIILPALTLLFGGDWSKTYWGCMEYWSFQDGHSWCNRPE